MRRLGIRTSMVLTGLFMAAILIHPCIGAAAEAVQVGGDATKVRVVFNLKEPVNPDILSEERTLIVNFPDIIGAPATFTNFFMIKDLSFDGSVAKITFDGPYRYTTTLQRNPPRLVVDVTPAQQAPKLCPIQTMESSTHPQGIRVKMHIGGEMWPRILYSRSAARVYLLFDQAVTCDDLQQRIERIPFMGYGGTIKMQGGAGIVFTIADAAKGLTIHEYRKTQDIVFEISSRETIDLAKISNLSRQAWDRGDMATVIELLKPSRARLNPEAMVLLASAWWRIGYPSDNALCQDATQLMGQGIAAMNPGLERERAMLTYADMLLAAHDYDEARKYIRFLKDSPDDAIAVASRIKEMNLLNAQAGFEDAFAANKRMLLVFPEDRIPADQRGFYDVALGDAYLGLNDYAKALGQYNRAVSEDPQLFKKDLGLYARMGDAAFKLNDLAKARYYLLQSVNVGDPRAKTIQLLRLGDCLYKLGETPKAVEVYSQVGNLPVQGENTVIAKLRKASIVIEGDPKTGGKISSKTFYAVLGIYDSIEIPPNSPERSLAPIVKIRRAQLYAKHGNWDEAFATFDQSWRETKPEDPLHKYAYSEAIISLNARLRELAGQGKYPAILDVYNKYRQSFLREIRDPELMFIIAQAMIKQGQNQSARGLLASCVQRPSAVREAALAALFQADVNLGNLNNALGWNTLYLTEYPMGPSAGILRERRGMILYRLHRFNEAVGYLEPMASSREPKALDALATLVDIYHSQNEVAREAQTLERIIALSYLYKSPVIEWALFMRAGQLMYSEPERAKALYETLRGAYPQSRYGWNAVFNTATILARQGQRARANALFNQIIQNSGNALLIKAARAHLAQADLLGAVAQVKPEAVAGANLPVVQPAPIAEPQPAIPALQPASADNLERPRTAVRPTQPRKARTARQRVTQPVQTPAPQAAAKPAVAPAAQPAAAAALTVATPVPAASAPSNPSPPAPSAGPAKDTPAPATPATAPAASTPEKAVAPAASTPPAPAEQKNP